MSRRHETVVALRGTDRARSAPRKQPPPAAPVDEKLAGRMGDDAILRFKEAAGVLGVSIETLQAWRSQGIGPGVVYFGNRARGHTVRALRDWIRQNERRGAGGA